MILTGHEIENELQTGNLHIAPFSPMQINPNSYNYRLGDTYVEIESETALDPRSRLPQPESKLIPPEGLIIQPGHLYLCHTLETIGSAKYVTSLIGKSSIGRLGLFLQVSANLGHQSQIHRWTLELRACIPIRIYAGMIIGQVTFWKTLGETYVNSGHYGFLNNPAPSIGDERWS